MKILSVAFYGRPSDRSPFGKRTTQLTFSTPDDIAQLAQVEAQRRGLTVSRFVEDLLVREVAGSHLVTIVHQVPARRNENNS